MYDFYRLIKVKENRDQAEKFDPKVHSCKKCLWEPLEVEENVLVLAISLRKKDALGTLYKSTTENKTFLNRDKTFTISKRLKLNNCTYLYWLKENRRKKK